MAVFPAYVPAPGQSDAQVSARAAALGIGIASRTIPPLYAPATTNLPGIIAEYNRQVVFLHDDGTRAPGDVAALIAPLQAQEAADIAARAAVDARKARITNAIAALNSRAATYAAQTVNAGNVVAVTQVIVNDLAIVYANLADLITDIYKP